VSFVVLLVFLLSGVFFFLGVRFYGPLVERWIGVDPNRKTPAAEFDDGQDYIPARPYVLFAHHFASIAGAGPIIGPTLALAYGYAPALAWVVLGSIFLGGVHDMCSLFISAREKGTSVAEVARKILGPSGYLLMISLLLVALLMITATFLNLSVTALTSVYPAEAIGMKPIAAAELQAVAGDARPGETVRLPTRLTASPMPQAVQVTEGDDGFAYQQMARIGGIASTSVLVITLVAPFLGWMIYRRKTPAALNYSVAGLLCIGSVFAGILFPVTLEPDAWRLILTVYVITASAVPVWLLLMPRDFVNVQILYVGVLVIAVGLVVSIFNGGENSIPAAPQSIAEAIPAWDASVGFEYIGMLWPLMFITVSCGAISGFHCLVCSGTSSKQLACESHARKVGYHGMLLEGFLAVCVILALFIGLDWENYQAIVYGQKNPVLGIALAIGNLLGSSLFLPTWAGTVLGILLLEGFIVTTLDVALRLSRYLLQEFWRFLLDSPPTFLLNAWVNTGVCAAIMFALSRSNTLPVLWQVFGSANQMMAAMALLVIAIWMRANRRRFAFALIPAIFMFATTFASSGFAFAGNLATGNWPLVATSGVLLFLAGGIFLVGGRFLLKPTVRLSSEEAEELTRRA